MGCAAVWRHVGQQEELGRSVQVSRGPDCSGGHRVGATPPSPRVPALLPPWGRRPEQAACGGLSSPERPLWGLGRRSGGKRPSLSF